MELLIGLLSAAIAATVSLIVAIISFVANRNALKSARESFERELQREMTNKLYEARLEVYPDAIAITDGLRKSRMARQGESPSREYFEAILSKIDDWHGQKSFLLLSRPAVQALYNLRDILREPPDSNGQYSPEQLHRIWRAKGKFRSALRSDIQLLYEEEVELLRED